MTQEESFDDSHAVTLWAANSNAVGRALKPGEIVGGSYKLKSLLGKGGMGYVFCAEHILIKRDYALKMLAGERLNDVSRRRFETEGKAIANLEHENIVKVYNMGIDRGDCPFYVMDLLDGVALSDCITGQTELSFSDCLDIFGQIASGLGYAHSKGIIHRDVKPSNVVLLPLGNGHVQAKIVDFGIAKLLNTESFEGQSQTIPGEVFGSPYYMSPEQCLGNSIDSRSDIYSLGCSLFEVLTGRPPYCGGNVLETVMMHQSAPVPSVLKIRPNKNLPPAVDVLLSRMMAKRPDDRYPSMQHLGHDLQRIKDGLPIGKAVVVAETAESDEVEATPAGGAAFGRGALLLTLVVSTFLAGGIGFLGFRGSQKNLPPAHVSDARPADVGALPPVGSEIATDIDKIKLVDMAVGKSEDKKNFSTEQIEVAKRLFSTCPLIVSKTVSGAGGRQRSINFPFIPLGEVSTSRADEKQAAGKVTLRDHNVGLSIKADEYIPIQVPIVFSRFAPDVLENLRLTGKKYGLGSLPHTFPQDQAENLSRILEYASHWTGLKHLSLNSFIVNDKVVNSLNMLPSLEHLELHAIQWEVSSRQSTAVFTRLQELQVDRMKNTGEICRYVANSKVLRKLKLDHSEISAEDFLVLAQCPEFKAVELSNIVVTDALVEAVIKIPSLEYVNCNTVTLTPSQLGALGTCGHLREVLLDQLLYEAKIRDEFARYPNLKFELPRRKG